MKRNKHIERPTKDYIQGAPEEHPHTIFFGVDLAFLDRKRQIHLVILVVFAFELLYGYQQELLFSKHKFSFEWFGSLVQFAIYSIFSLLQYAFLEPAEPRTRSRSTSANQKWVGTVGITMSTLVARGFGIAAFKYLDYALKVLFQSAKPVLVMIFGVAFQNKRYKTIEYVGTFMLIVGLAIFSIADAKTVPTFHIYGVILVLISLVADTFKSTTQENATKVYKLSEIEAALYSSLLGVAFSLVVSIISGQLIPGFYYLLNNAEITVLLCVQCFIGYIAWVAILVLCALTNAFTESLVTTVRKAGTVFLSFILFQKQAGLLHWLSTSIFFVGLLIQILPKRAGSKAVVHKS